MTQGWRVWPEVEDDPDGDWVGEYGYQPRHAVTVPLPAPVGAYFLELGVVRAVLLGMPQPPYYVGLLDEWSQSWRTPEDVAAHLIREPLPIPDDALDVNPVTNGLRTTRTVELQWATTGRLQAAGMAYLSNDGPFAVCPFGTTYSAEGTPGHWVTRRRFRWSPWPTTREWVDPAPGTFTISLPPTLIEVT